MGERGACGAQDLRCLGLVEGGRSVEALDVLDGADVEAALAAALRNVTNPKDIVRTAFLCVLTREPTAKELEALRDRAASVFSP